MKNGSVLFLGLFAALGISWAGIIVGSDRQIGNLAPYYDQAESQAYPEGLPGVAARGEKVYRDLDCASCHTQQVRRTGFGNDEARGWGTRQSVARDYIFQPAVHLGELRIGPDLANFGARKATREDVLKLLYQGQGGMPPYRFLFVGRRIDGQRSAEAIDIPGAVPAGYELVPTARAETLVSYLLSLSSSYDYPETR